MSRAMGIEDKHRGNIPPVPDIAIGIIVGVEEATATVDGRE